MLSAPTGKAALVPAAGLACALTFALGPATAPPAVAAPAAATRPAAGPLAGVRVAITGGLFTASLGIIWTTGRTVYGHPCAAAGDAPTPFTALVDAEDEYHFGLEAHWDAATKDFVVDNIHGDAADGKKWNAYVNDTKITTSPCATAIKDTDKVRWTLE
ncbi:hypothetical protein [Streptomyces sp. NRRL S-337]|uniref:hypothetical protein n=1 Tax=Streptomyces sp. NRRL S-337 TaxID=1463900 RepID=UPI0004C97DAF|nr:hypothetical protein [Streptomyces sp. NRRL S-337]